MEEIKIKILRLPSFFRKQQFSAQMNCCLIPPLGLGLISAYLRHKGIRIEQDDLDIKLHHDNNYPESPGDVIDTEIFFDLSRILRYASGEEDCYLESVLKKVSLKSGICDNQITLLSLPDNIENNSNLAFAIAFSKFIKENYRTTNILGGDNIWIDLLRAQCDCRHIDFVIYGDGEQPVYHLLDFLLHNQRIDNIPGLTISDGGKVIRSNIISRPIKPDFAGLPLEKYKSRNELLNYPDEIHEVKERFLSSKTMILPYRFTRGCPFECAFCVSSTKPLSHALSPEEAVDHLDYLQAEFHPTGFFFLNDTINISKGYINGLCDEILKRRSKILWSDCARVDNLDRDTLFKMRQSGCIRLIFGMETASPRLLKYINKRIDLRQLEDTLKWSDQAGIWTGVEVICGLPQENDEDIDATISFLNRNQPYINRIYLNHFDLRENTPFYNASKNYGIERIWEVNEYAEKDFISYVRFGFDESGGLSWKDKQRQIERSLERVRDNCARGLRYFTDEHMLFFLYSYLGDKKKISHIYSKIVNHGS